MESLREAGGAIINAKCVPNSVLGEIIPHPETKLAEVGGGPEAVKQGSTSCDLTLDTKAAALVWATRQISTNTPIAIARQATLLWQTHSEEGGGNLGVRVEPEAGEEEIVVSAEEGRGLC